MFEWVDESRQQREAFGDSNEGAVGWVIEKENFAYQERRENEDEAAASREGGESKGTQSGIFAVGSAPGRGHEQFVELMYEQARQRHARDVVEENDINVRDACSEPQAKGEQVEKKLLIS